MSHPYNSSNYTPDESVGYLLKRTGSTLAIAIDRALAEYEMTHAQLGIFLKLLHKQANTAADLARETMSDTGSMTRILDRLEEKGFIQRTRSSADRRVVQVELTPKGERLADTVSEVAMTVLNHHLRGFSLDEVEQLKGLLRRMIANA